MGNGTVSVPASVVGTWAGVDAGATLCKLCTVPGPDSFQTVSFDSTDLEGVHRTLDHWGLKGVVAIGGGAAEIAESSGLEVQIVGEFDAWASGARLLAEMEGLSVPADHLVVSLGTGTSILLVRDSGAPRRVGGSALGGGTLLGLGKLLLGVDSFRELVQMAGRGDRRRVDLLVGDVYASGNPPLAADLNAASFAKLESRDPEDIAHALCGLIGENISLMAAQLAHQHGVETIFLCGSTLDQNRPLQQILIETAGMLGLEASLIETGAYAGAVGALSMAAL